MVKHYCLRSLSIYNDILGYFLKSFYNLLKMAKQIIIISYFMNIVYKKKILEIYISINVLNISSKRNTIHISLTAFVNSK